jgi:lipopolysaccharide transport protein LptA
MSQLSGDEAGSARTVSGARGETRFSPQGEAIGFTIEGDVKIWDGDLVATADRALIDSEEGEVELFGNPVKLTHPRGTLEAGQLRYLEDMSMIHGHSGIVAVLTESETREALSVAGQEGPIRVIAEETFWLSEPDGVLFQGSVRAWQGEYALLANQLRGEEGEGRMSAAGGVRTLWNPPDDEEASGRRRPGPESPEDGEAEPEPRPQGPMEVSADEMIYRQAENELSYSGSVRADQDRSSLACDKLDVILDENNETERLECTGNVRIEDAETGLSFEAARALYDLQNETIDVFGDSIVIRDKEGRGADNVRELNYSFQNKVMLLRSESEVAQADDT